MRTAAGGHPVWYGLEPGGVTLCVAHEDGAGWDVLESYARKVERREQAARRRLRWLIEVAETAAGGFLVTGPEKLEEADELRRRIARAKAASPIDTHAVMWALEWQLMKMDLFDASDGESVGVGVS